jgi:hypothetical protein
MRSDKGIKSGYMNYFCKSCNQCVVGEQYRFLANLLAIFQGREQGLTVFCLLLNATSLLNTVVQAVTAECVLTKFENARHALLESLHQVEETIPEAIGSKVIHNLT